MGRSLPNIRSLRRHWLPAIYSVLALSWRILRAEAVTAICILISVRSYLAHTNQMQITIPQNVTCQAFLMPLSTKKKVAGFDSTITGWF
jgi:hypothetical protein